MPSRRVRSSSTRKASPRSNDDRRRFLVTILGKATSSYDEQRVRALKANPAVILWLESDGSSLTVARREGRVLKPRHALRGQGAEAIESLFREPVQGITHLMPGGGDVSRKRAVERLRKAIDIRNADGEWELLKRRRQEGVDIVSLEPPHRGHLCVLVEREPHIGLPYLRSTSTRGPRIEARNASYDPILKLVALELRGVSPSAVLIDALDLTIVVDDATLHLYDSSKGERSCPGLGFADQIRVEPSSVGAWRWFCFDSPRLKDPPLGSNGRPAIVKLKNLDGRLLKARIELPDCVRDPLSPLYGLVPGIAPGDPPRRSPVSGQPGPATAERQQNDKSDSVAN